MAAENSDSHDKTSVFILVAEELKKIVSKEPRMIYSDPERLSILLKQNLGPKHVREIYLAVTPMRANIVRQLLYVSDKKDLYRKLSSTVDNIQSQTGYDEVESRWAVYTWAYALDKVTQEEFYEINQLRRLSPHSVNPPEPMEDVPPEPMEDVSSPEKEYPPTDIEQVFRVPKKPKYYSIFTKNQVRIPLGIAIAAGLIALIVVIANQSGEVTTDRPVAFFTVNPEPKFGDQLIALDGSGSKSGNGFIADFTWSYKVDDKSEIKLPQNDSKAEFTTPSIGNVTQMNILLRVENNRGYSNITDQHFNLRPNDIIFNLNFTGNP